MMFAEMFRELFAMSTALVVLQRLESRHSLLKRFLAWKHKSLPMTLSAAMRRRQNGDLQRKTFQASLTDLLGSIGELRPGPWQCKAELIERFCHMSGQAAHDPLAAKRALKDSFVEGLAKVCAPVSDSVKPGALELVAYDESLQREHVRATLKRNRFYAVRGYLKPGAWAVFRVINTNPGGNMSLQRSVHLSGDVP